MHYKVHQQEISLKYSFEPTLDNPKKYLGCYPRLEDNSTLETMKMYGHLGHVHEI